MIHLDLFACCKPEYVLVSVSVFWGTTPHPFGGNDNMSQWRPESENVVWHLQCCIIKHGGMMMWRYPPRHFIVISLRSRQYTGDLHFVGSLNVTLDAEAWFSPERCVQMCSVKEKLFTFYTSWSRSTYLFTSQCKYKCITSFWYLHILTLSAVCPFFLIQCCGGPVGQITLSLHEQNPQWGDWVTSAPLMTPASLFLLEPPSPTHQWIVMQCCDSISYWKICPAWREKSWCFIDNHDLNSTHFHCDYCILLWEQKSISFEMLYIFSWFVHKLNS